MKWQDSSEIVAGLLLAKRIASSAVRPELLMPPYSDIARLIKEGVIEPEELIQKVGLEPVQVALSAEKAVNGAGDMNWLSILDKSYRNTQIGKKLIHLGKKMEDGEEAEVALLRSYANEFESGLGETTPLSAIQSSEMPFVRSGWNVLDEHLGGLPEIGLVIVGGNPSVGKTSFAARLITQFVKEHRTKNAAFYSLEMVLPEIAGRIREVSNLNDEQANRLLINAEPFTAEQVVADAARIDDLGLVLIDFADYMVRGEITESSMGSIYRTLAIGTKQLKCPIVLLSQLSRNYKGGIPKPYHIRYTSLAEILGWMLLMLYNPTIGFYEDHDAEALPIVDKVAYIIAWKCRGGFRIHKDDSPGAIAVPFVGAKGWHPTQSKWFSLKKE